MSLDIAEYRAECAFRDMAGRAPCSLSAMNAPLSPDTDFRLSSRVLSMERFLSKLFISSPTIWSASAQLPPFPHNNSFP